MANVDFSKRDSFGSKFGVIAATAGSAVGLGNIWRFPYVAGESGGGALTKIPECLIAGVPVFCNEIAARTYQDYDGVIIYHKPEEIVSYHHKIIVLEKNGLKMKVQNKKKQEPNRKKKKKNDCQKY